MKNDNIKMLALYAVSCSVFTALSLALFANAAFPANTRYDVDVTVAPAKVEIGPTQTMHREQCIQYVGKLFWKRNQRVVDSVQYNANYRLYQQQVKQCNKLPIMQYTPEDATQQRQQIDRDFGTMTVRPL